MIEESKFCKTAAPPLDKVPAVAAVSETGDALLINGLSVPLWVCQ